MRDKHFKNLGQRKFRNSSLLEITVEKYFNQLVSEYYLDLLTEHCNPASSLPDLGT